MSEKSVKGSKGLRSSIKSNGHSSSGGHAIKQNSAFSRANRTRWNWSDGICGDNTSNMYQEYPKHIYNDDKNPRSYVIVNSAAEEQQVLGGEEIINEDDERTRLLTLANVKNVPVDKRWGPAKITKAIEDAGFDPTLDPFA